MYLFTRTADLRQYLLAAKSKGATIGFVPTMGALHPGHLALIQQSQHANELTVCSIFVNPTQFTQAADLEKYPRTPTRDIALLAKVGCDVLFMPAEAEIYPPDAAPAPQPAVALGRLAEVLEGQFRPGHFDGVVQVVRRLLDIVPADQLIMGQKDWQQTAVLRAMIAQLGLPVQLVIAPIVREEDGLAMSSRNVRLTPAWRQLAPTIHQVLLQAQAQARTHTAAHLCAEATQQLSAAGFLVEYFAIVHPHTLEPIADLPAAPEAIACVALWAGEVRLIDNVVIEGE